MRQYDFSPLYRSFVGFDRMANLIDAASQQASAGNSYPPYNVAQLSENAYRIVIKRQAPIMMRQNICTAALPSADLNAASNSPIMYGLTGQS